MYDIKSIETGEKDQDIVTTYCTSSSVSTSSSIADFSTTANSMSLRRRRIFQRQACLLSVMAAFSLGLALGVFVPMVGMSAAITSDLLIDRVNQTVEVEKSPVDAEAFSVSFVKERKLPAEEVFRNAFHLEQDKNADDLMIVKKLEPSDGSIKEFKVQRTPDGYFRKGPEVRLSKPSLTDQVLSGNEPKSRNHISVEFVPITPSTPMQEHPAGVIDNDIYWGDVVERSLPRGFSNGDADKWNKYVMTSSVSRLETGCGRMQNRMVVFKDGSRACARYRQNTDQIQGELFSFYLGQLLNLTNLAPSAASVIDLETETWSGASLDISNAQWKSSRPVVLTKWLPDLEPAGIPTPFQPLERHLNKFDVWNITAEQTKTNKAVGPQKGLLDRLGATGGQPDGDTELEAAGFSQNASQSQGLTPLNSTVLNRLVELAQWSDLIVFDYLIANLDRVVNNLYNYQWNADIMAAPAHNLARQINSQLLVFLDNESGLLHGYRLLKKYEAYHGLLLDNLCVFRRPTIEALRWLRDDGGGGGGSGGVEYQLQQLFERSTSPQLRDVLPSLPDKSIKILNDRIDRVLGQVQKCRDLFADR
ncbi:unnamed protein product [Hermetia illucens]|uniref:Uncharacterized protein n=1 Tax=Hermetia illucens TaxID=343691 RepID=A0A7R8YL33_HERIL|nr:extracellular serine/threonine protein kinase four-jointed [Hermetia illucens]CAD7076693.1 unnamed protein product [Hermetia illucens]